MSKSKGSWQRLVGDDGDDTDAITNLDANYCVASAGMYINIFISKVDQNYVCILRSTSIADYSK